MSTFLCSECGGAGRVAVGRPVEDGLLGPQVVYIYCTSSPLHVTPAVLTGNLTPALAKE